MALLDIKSPTTSGGAFWWLILGLAVLLVGTSAVFYYAGYF